MLIAFIDFEDFSIELQRRTDTKDFLMTNLIVVLGDLWPESDREAGKEEPDYIKTEREQFGSFRDLNKDGKMDRVGIIIHNLFGFKSTRR